ncbi:GNAT family N-acetyltransferase [Dysgonomonas sp. 520]|uniref:GNAT family N-acetyltransferase n=1 Tax=Dysgonomonas sp. 520 TaxID=2302931 RepID=UPI0013D1DA2C|nr:N-acetyltransferase [Dysgonomonas sp. 520]NDW10011.1 N-acetyltransferase [Dysgonomonas sp. 520]
MDNDLIIRQELEKDYPAVKKLVKAAFADELHSDHKEHELVEKLRQTDAFVPPLSLVAVLEKKIVGYILLSEITVGESNFTSLAMAPVAVLPEFQNQGIGSLLIREAHEKAKDLGYTSVILLGHKDYYPKFGYKPLGDFGIQLPFDVPQEYAMGLELVSNALNGISGRVHYPPAFFD